MADPFADDSWDELSRELGVEKSPPGAQTPPEESIKSLDFEEVIVESQIEEGEYEGDSEAEAPDGAEAPAGDEQPGPGRKRRRRRRRRKKGGPEGEGEDALPTAPEAALGEVDESEIEADSEETEEEPGDRPFSAEEDTAGEALRELIATWNVPSWDSIITSLYRPER